MDIRNMSRTQKLTFSAMIIALYCILVYLTQGFSFGAYQIRIATSLYALSYLFPFLVFPLGLANFLSNFLFGGLGPLDMFGGLLVGLVTAGLNAVIARLHGSHYLVIPVITLIPGLGVATWLSYLLHFPYPLMALNLCVGQLIPAICGALWIVALKRVLHLTKAKPEKKKQEITEKRRIHDE